MAHFNINRIPIFTQEVFHFTLPNFEEWKKHINQIIMVEDNKNIHAHDTEPEYACNVIAKRTAWNSHHRYQILDELSKEISSYLEKFIEKEGYDIPKLVVTDCWINWYKKNQYAQPHTHGHHLSVVLFVDVEKTNGKFFFYTDNYTVLAKQTDAHTNFSNTVQVDAKDGTVLFFDGSVRHSVSANTTENRRVTVAINYRVTYNQKREEY